MLRCNEVTRLYATEEVRHASLRTRLGARLHLMMCRSCQRYVKELAAMGEAVRKLARDDAQDPGRLEALIRRVLPDGDEPRE